MSTKEKRANFKETVLKFSEGVELLHLNQKMLTSLTKGKIHHPTFKDLFLHEDDQFYKQI